MPKINNVGQSEHTVTKQEILLDTINAVYYALYGIKKKHGYNITFNWIDANSGCGKNLSCNCDGSPVIFQESMMQKKWPHMIYCVEKDPENIDSLKKSMIQNRFVRYFNCDHNEIIPTILTEIGDSPYGILYHDPNGEPSWNMLIDAANIQNTRKLDFLIHMSATNGVKRLSRFGRSDLYNSVQKINKKHWYILPCHHIGSDAEQWCFLFGTNLEHFNSLKRIGYARIDESAGEAILNVVNHKKNTSPSDMIAPQKPLNAFFRSGLYGCR
mgnify:FL=1